jgi:hypothetical protein
LKQLAIEEANTTTYSRPSLANNNNNSNKDNSSNNSSHNNFISSSSSSRDRGTSYSQIPRDLFGGIRPTAETHVKTLEQQQYVLVVVIH